VEGFVHVGELHYLWLNGVLGSGSNQLCGCRLKLTGCPLWSCVLGTEVGELGTVAGLAEAIRDWQLGAYRTRHTWRLLRGTREELDRRSGYLRVMAAVYRAVRDATGARVIVDTSKFASEAAALLHVDDIDVRALHMVRDPRAVAWSWHRQKAYIGRRGGLDSTWNWIGFNLAAEAVARRLPGRTLRLRYEDFTAEPERAVAGVLRLAGEVAECSPVRGRTVNLGTNHTVTGNPDRFLSGCVEIRDDGAWRSGLPVHHRRQVTALALPWLRRYGYPYGL
jgi:hypothetical protein